MILIENNTPTNKWELFKDVKYGGYEMSRNITVHYENKPLYDITIEKNYDKLGEVFDKLGTKEHRICVVTDSTVGKFYLDEVMSIARNYSIETISFTFEAGEQSKNLDTVGDLYETLIKAKFDRKDILVALGGGVVGDLTGYAASTYLRGIKVVQMPTSLLSMVDSSVGGKTGVDFRGYKNMIGAFHQPSAVYMNLSTLKTLTDEQYFSGYGEIIKHGLIRDMEYFDYLDAHSTQIAQRELDVLEEVVAVSCNIKRVVVENDPKEKGERALLNFGHTLGHAIEKLMNFTMLHGECVAVGMVAAAYMSAKRGMISEGDYQRVVSMIKALKLPVCVSGITADDVIEISKSDKKMEAGKIKFVLLDNMGNAVIRKDVTDDDMREALKVVLSE